MKRIRHVEIETLDAGEWGVTDLIDRLIQVKKDCGANAKIVIDAGYNNVSFDVIPSVKKPKNVSLINDSI